MVNGICETYALAQRASLAESLNECPEDPAQCSCSQYPGDLEANPDVGGTGVLIGFVGTASLVVILVIIRYVFAYDPRVNPFNDKKESFQGGPGHACNSKIQWTPNPIDDKTVGWLRKKFRRVDREVWEKAMEQVFLTTGDVQLLTGFGILLSGVIPLQTYISAYHWELIVRLAWFSSSTHAACLTALRRYFHKNQAQRNWRLVLMVLLLVALIVSILPTAYFNWQQESEEGSAAIRSSNARCFFDRDMIPKLWCPPLACLRPYGGRPRCEWLQDSKYAQSTTAYESHILSILILIINFTTRAVKVTRTLSGISRNYLRESLSRLYLSLLNKVNKQYQQLPNGSTTKRLWYIFRPLDMLLGGYLTAKFYADVISSELFDVYCLFISALWGALRLWSVSRSGFSGERTEWTFGQILPVFLLAGPLASIALSMPVKPLGFVYKLGTTFKTLRAWIRARTSSENPHETRGITQIRSQELSTLSSRVESVSDTDAVGRQQDLRNTQANTGMENESIALESGGLEERRDSPMDFEPFNQDLVTVEDDAETIQSHLCNYYLRSRWISFCFVFVWLQVISLTVVGLLFLLVYGKPSSMLVSGVFIILLPQPIALFSVITVGLYVSNHQSSRLFSLFPAILHIMLLVLISGGFFIIGLRSSEGEIPFEPRPLALAPLTLLVGLSLYLNVVR